MMRHRVEAGREAASRWSAPSPAIRPRRDNARSCSSFDESPAGYSWQVALQQRLLPLHQPRSFCYEWERRASKNQRTANSGLTGCLSSGVHRRSFVCLETLPPDLRDLNRLRAIILPMGAVVGLLPQYWPGPMFSCVPVWLDPPPRRDELSRTQCSRQHRTCPLLGRVHTNRSASTMSAKQRNARKTTSSFSKREKMRRKPLSLRNNRSISLRFL